jgi:FAD/FMN-containing dehydrogenase/Fe-S oxidoreductase
MHDFTALRHDALIRALRQQVDGEVRFDAPSRALYSTDASLYQVEPLGVVVPRTPEALNTAVQIALELEIPLVPRGGGTSLSGQAVGPGVVIDCSKYLTKILDFDAVSRTVRVQPGVVLEQLNRFLEPHGLQFGPDVSTHNRACLGGMIGNNSAGARSIVYGKTGDHVRSLTTLLSAGPPVRCAVLPAGGWERLAEQGTVAGRLHHTLQKLVQAHAAEIRTRFPPLQRRVSGYDLLGLLERGATAGLLPVLIGSEGTLGVVTEAELAVVPKPKLRGLLVPHFDSLAAALDTLAVCLELQPSAVELLDDMLIRLARQQRSLAHKMAAVVGTPAALLMIEFSGADAAEVSYRLHELERKLARWPGVQTCVIALDPAERDPLWELRRAAVPLLYNLPGPRKPVAFVEDTAVPPSRLPKFAAAFRAILRAHGTDGAFYGHASVGCLHIRPLLDLHNVADVRTMRQITAEVTDLVRAFGGALSGEHGDGLARSEWNRTLYGPIIANVFEQIKRTFDPLNLFNPGKIVHAPPMTDQLRHAAGRPRQPVPTVFDYNRQDGFFASIEQCNGSGVCRKTQGGAMCPSYRATRDERDSTRGRANALRHALTHGTGDLGQRWLFDVMDLCLSCKACQTECPSNVDVSKLKSEFLHAYYRTRPRPPSHYLLANVQQLFRIGAEFAPLANWAASQPVLRWLLDKAAGIDQRRSLPPLHRDHLRRWFARRPRRGTGPRVLLFDDCFTTFNEPSVGQAAVRVLESAGYRVELVNGVCCGRPHISKGFLREARQLAAAALPALAKRVADGTPIVGLEPSCGLTLADEWPELVPGPAARQVAQAVHLADGWLADQVRRGQCHLPLERTPGRWLLHPHCHQRARVGGNGSLVALQLIPGAQVQMLDAGCCGMAGAFGYESQHYDLSVQIAGQQLVPAVSAEPDAEVVAPGTSCRQQLRDLTNRTARHPLEVLAAALPRDKPG